MTIYMYAPWVHSLKEKRMVVKSLLAKIQNKFNVSAAEIDSQDVHQTIVIAVAAIAMSPSQADSVMDHVIRFVEEHSEAQVTDIERELR